VTGKFHTLSALCPGKDALVLLQ